MFIREDFPAPDGPMIAVSSPEGNIPDMLFSIHLSAEIREKVKYIIASTTSYCTSSSYQHNMRGLLYTDVRGNIHKGMKSSS